MSTASIPPTSSSPAAAEPAREPDFDRDIHFAQAAKPRTAGRRGNLAGMVIGYGLAGAVAIAFLISRQIAAMFSLPPTVVAIFWAVVVAGVLIALAPRLFRWYTGQQFRKGLTLLSDERYRVRCAGSPHTLTRLDALGPIRDTPFEPQEFTGLLVLRPRPYMIALWVVISVSVIVLLFLYGFRMSGIIAGFAWLVFYAAFAAGGFAVALLWPTKIRVVPGRIDVLRSLVFTPDRPERRTVTLRTSGVLVDLKRWRAVIDGPSPETSLDLWLWPVRGRIDLAHAILMAAVSTAHPGPLPEDQPG